MLEEKDRLTHVLQASPDSTEARHLRADIEQHTQALIHDDLQRLALLRDLYGAEAQAIRCAIEDHTKDLIVEEQERLAALDVVTTRDGAKEEEKKGES